MSLKERYDGYAKIASKNATWIPIIQLRVDMFKGIYWKTGNYNYVNSESNRILRVYIYIYIKKEQRSESEFIYNISQLLEIASIQLGPHAQHPLSSGCMHIHRHLQSCQLSASIVHLGGIGL